jgi:tRNA(Ile2) C34 agmatinyltransferase TiaS
MNYYSYNEREKPPCPNCGKPNSATMSSTSWMHNYACCSDRCGKRLAKRIENGMFHGKNEEWYIVDNCTESLRNRIRHLKNQLKRNGIKPIKG